MTGPPQLRFEPRDQFLQRKWFHQIIVGAAAQALDPILNAAACGEDQHRDRIVSVPYFAQHRQTVAVGQSEVEDQGRVMRREQNAGRLFDRGQHVGLVARVLQALYQEIGEFFIVFDDQQPHPRRLTNLSENQR